MDEDSALPISDDFASVVNGDNEALNQGQAAARARVQAKKDNVIRLHKDSSEQQATRPGPPPLGPAQLPDPCPTPARQWLYGSHLIRGYVSVLVSPGGTG